MIAVAAITVYHCIPHVKATDVTAADVGHCILICISACHSLICRDHVVWLHRLVKEVAAAHAELKMRALASDDVSNTDIRYTTCYSHV
jgi:hypothetical protein